MALKKILIIGDGPSAVSFAQQACTGDHKIILMSAGKVNEESHFSKKNPKNSLRPWKFSPSSGSKSSINVKNNFFYYDFKGPGGLSNSWGAGCSKINHNDIGVNLDFVEKLDPYYDLCEERIGLTSYGSDGLDDYLGKFNQTSKHVNINPRFEFKQMSNSNITLGFTRQAITTVDKSENRKACINCEGSFTNCEKGSIYNAKNCLKDFVEKIDLIEESYANNIEKTENGYLIRYMRRNREETIETEILILASGPVETSKLIHSLLSAQEEKYQEMHLKLNHNPMTRLFFFSFRKNIENNFPAGQIVGRIKYTNDESFYLSLVDGVSIPTSDIMLNSPFKNKFIYKIIDIIKKYLVFGFVFFSSDHSDVEININSKSISIEQNEERKISSLISFSRKIIRKFFINNGLLLMPKVLSYMTPGSDLHLGSVFPIGKKKYLNVDENCNLNGMKDLYIVDGSWLPRVPEKPHTFTLMANAVRVADYING